MLLCFLVAAVSAMLAWLSSALDKLFRGASGAWVLHASMHGHLRHGLLLIPSVAFQYSLPDALCCHHLEHSMHSPVQASRPIVLGPGSGAGLDSLTSAVSAVADGVGLFLWGQALTSSMHTPVQVFALRRSWAETAVCYFVSQPLPSLFWYTEQLACCGSGSSSVSPLLPKSPHDRCIDAPSDESCELAVNRLPPQSHRDLN